MMDACQSDCRTAYQLRECMIDFDGEFGDEGRLYEFVAQGQKRPAASWIGNLDWSKISVCWNVTPYSPEGRTL
jgi:hypothetical protein